MVAARLAFLGLVAMAPRLAAAACDPLDAAGLQALTDVARDALFAEDLATADGTVARVEEQAPCLTEQVAPEAWAPLLVTLAIARYSANEDWQTPLASALAAHPAVDRVVGDTHPIATWTPPAMAEEVLERAPSGAELYLDGKRVSYLPELLGPHLLQGTVEGQLASRFVVSDPEGTAWGELLDELGVEEPEAAESQAAASTLPTEPVAPGEQGLSTGSLALLGGGVLAGGLGGGAILYTSGQANQGVLNEREWEDLRTLNTAGWGLAGVGGALLLGGTLTVALGGRGTLVPTHNGLLGSWTW